MVSKHDVEVTLPFTVQLCTYFSNYNYWVITSTNPEPTPKPTPVPCTYLMLASTFKVSTL